MDSSVLVRSLLLALRYVNLPMLTHMSNKVVHECSAVFLVDFSTPSMLNLDGHGILGSVAHDHTAIKQIYAATDRLKSLAGMPQVVPR